MLSHFYSFAVEIKMYDQSFVVVSKFKQNKKEQPQFILLSPAEI